jgi:NADP-dependent 3-hydroxy acid dehydrogenase YdfG
MINNSIEGKVFVITEASSGMGEAAAKHLAKLGAWVVPGFFLWIFKTTGS